MIEWISMNKPKLVVLLGPTASGKSSLAIELAKEFDGEIIAADSRTVYKEMNIGTAKPTGQKRRDRKDSIKNLFSDRPLIVEDVSHWGISIINPDEDFNAAQFKKYAEEKIKDITKRGKLAILAGGTGLYISAIVDNLAFTDAPKNEELRAEIEEMTNNEIIEQIRELDAEGLETLDESNRRRLTRALEILKTTGKPLSAQKVKSLPKFDVLQLGIKKSREVLNERIDMRVDQMIAGGLVDEVRGLKEKYGCEINSMTGIGYRQICSFLDGYMKLKDAIEVLKRDTRHYAKRQMTWFKRDDRINWIENKDEAFRLVREFRN